MRVEPHRVSFEMEWDLPSFIEEQRYTEKRPEDAISRAITLTGSSQDCQATTTGQYLSQNWPLTGSHMMELIQRLDGGEPGSGQSGKLDSLLPYLVRWHLAVPRSAMSLSYEGDNNNPKSKFIKSSHKVDIVHKISTHICTCSHPASTRNPYSLYK